MQDAKPFAGLKSPTTYSFPVDLASVNNAGEIEEGATMGGVLKLYDPLLYFSIVCACTTLTDSQPFTSCLVLLPYWALVSLTELNVKSVGKPKPCLKFLSCSFQCFILQFRDELRREECKKVCRPKVESQQFRSYKTWQKITAYFPSSILLLNNAFTMLEKNLRGMVTPQFGSSKRVQEGT